MMLLMVLMSGTHWIPARQEEFVTFCHVWLNVLENEAMVTAFGWDKPTVMTLRGSACGGRKPFRFASGIHWSMNFIIVETSTVGRQRTALVRLCAPCMADPSGAVIHGDPFGRAMPH
jgi:hypothetical protein